MAAGSHLRQRIGLAIVTISLIIPFALSITDAEALLHFKKSLKKTEALTTWVYNTSPCEWNGVECTNGVVSSLKLDSMGLEGQINVNALMALIGLGTISLENNSFAGSIPALNRIKGLKTMHIARNGFSGEIPGGYFVGMVSLRSVRFADNQFSGVIPWSLDKVSNLVELELQNNMFNGLIPELKQRSLALFNVSNNQLTGEVPEVLWKFNSSSFAGNAELCGMNLKRPCKEGKLDKRMKGVEEAIDRMITVGGAGLIALVLLALLFIKSEESRSTFNFAEKSTTSWSESMGDATFSRLGTRSNSLQISDLVMVNEQKGVFGMVDVMKAGAESLGDGKDSGFGMSYKAVMANGMTVVVKRMKDCNRVGRNEFEMEMRMLGKVKHPNLLPPLAYHYRRDEKLFITEFIPAGSLFYLLHGDPKIRKELNWAVRLIIIKGIARGLDYLHSTFPAVALPHGNLKSSNVLISSNCEPHLSEFGLDKVVNTNQAGNFLFAYKAPEAANYGIITPKCDVFCLGIVILEILTGKFPFQYLAGGSKGSKGMDVLGWVEMCIAQGRVLEVFDRDLVMNVTPSSRLEMEKLLYIGADCAERNPELRLTLEEAYSRIEQIRYEVSQEYHRPPYSSDSSLPPYSALSTSLDSFSSQSQGLDSNYNQSGRLRLDGLGSQSAQRSSFDHAMIKRSYAEIAGNSGRSVGKTKLKMQDKHINLSSRLKQDGYDVNQGDDKKSVKTNYVPFGHREYEQRLKNFVDDLD